MKKSAHQNPSTVLVVEDDFDLREALVDTLSFAGLQTLNAASAEEAFSILKKNNEIDLVVSDVNMGEMSGHDLLRAVKAEFPQIPVLLITAFASISESVTAMKEGASDYLVKPFESDVFLETVKKFLPKYNLSQDEPIAFAESSVQLLNLAKRVAQSETTVLLSGESGTGKEVLAKYVHAHSARAKKPFVAINCAAIPENMLEAILFGYEKGAYTGAQTSTPGKFEQANGGTILLDEISEMELGLQAKLLRVLQEREVERLGGRKSIPLDVRVIATSNRDMRREVSEGKFREDLYFRLSVLPLQWAPLRDRKEDILPLAEALLEKHAKKQGRSGVTFSASAKTSLINYPWPGNVRELDNVMQRALILQAGSSIEDVDLGLNVFDSFSQKPSLVEAAHYESTSPQLSASKGYQASDMQTVSATSGAFSQTEEVVEGAGYQAHGLVNSNLPHNTPTETSAFSEGVEQSLDDSAKLGSDMRKHEFEIIVKTLRQENGSKKNTAERLGISPRTLRYKIARLREEGFNLESAMAF